MKIIPGGPADRAGSVCEPNIDTLRRLGRISALPIVQMGSESYLKRSLFHENSHLSYLGDLSSE